MSNVSFIILICLSNLEIWDRFYPRFTLPSWDFFGGTLFDQAILVFSEFSFQHVAPKKKKRRFTLSAGDHVCARSVSIGWSITVGCDVIASDVSISLPGQNRVLALCEVDVFAADVPPSGTVSRAALSLASTLGPILFSWNRLARSRSRLIAALD